MTVPTYNAAEINISVGGANISGYASGTFVSISSEAPLYNPTVGADGEVSRSRSNNRSGTLTLTLLQTSASNDVLSALAAADELTDGGCVPFFLKDSRGRTLVTAQCWIQQYPDVVFSDQEEGRAWTIYLAQMSRFVGGNAAVEAAQ